jgi:hypothetical protein
MLTAPEPETVLDSQMLSRLYRSIQSSQRKLEPFCKQRIERLKYLVGKHYGDNGTDEEQPLAIFEMLISVYARQLASSTPQVVVNTPYEQLKASAADLQLAINHLIAHEINLTETLRKVVVDALIGVGIVKVGLAASPNSEREMGFDHDPGQPFADAISLENLIVDMTAKTWQEVHYIGDMYQMPLEDVVANEAFNAETRAKLQARSESTKASESGEDLRSEQLQTGAPSSTGSDEEFVPLVSLMDVWLPRYNLLLTLPADDLGVGTQPLRVVEWDGPERGPYHILGFEDVPGNLLPLPTATLIEDLHDMANILFNKLGRQANRQKTVIGVAAGAGGDAERVRDAVDGEIIPLTDPKNVAEYRYGGIDQSNFGFVMQVRQLASLLGGNLDALGGLSAQSDTVGQDKLLVGNASQRVKDMQDRMALFVTRVVSDLALYLWEDPLIDLPMVKRIEGTDIEIPFNYTPERREGDFLQYNFTIDPFSRVVKSPEEKGQELLQFVMTVLPVVAPFMQASGQTINTEKLFKIIAKYGLQDLNDIILYAEGEMDTDAQTPVMPNNTTRTYERVSRSTSGTRASQEAVIAQAAFGGNPQPKEQMAAVRMPGM